MLRTHQSGPCCASLRLPHSTPFRLLAHRINLMPCLPLDSAVRVCVQPAAELQHVPRPEHAVHASGALDACPCHQLQSGPRCASLRPPVSWPAYRPLSIPPFGLGRTRLRSTSRSALIPPASLTWTTCFTCAPRLPMPPTHQSGPCCLGHRPHALPSPRPAYRPLSMPPFGLGRTRMRSTSR